jgi:energy-coupling factor transport system substrate-specific component
MNSKSLWKFGTREVVYSAIGAALYAVLSWATNFLQIPAAGNVAFRPAVAIPMFFGVVFGPIVGFIAGFLGNIIGDLLSGYGFWIWWDIMNGLMGLVTGLVVLVGLKGYKGWTNILKVEGFIVLAVLIAAAEAAVSEIWVSGVDLPTTIATNFIPTIIPNLLNGLILVPILLVAYDAIASRSGR